MSPADAAALLTTIQALKPDTPSHILSTLAESIAKLTDKEQMLEYVAALSKVTGRHPLAIVKMSTALWDQISDLVSQAAKEQEQKIVQEIEGTIQVLGKPDGPPVNADTVRDLCARILQVSDAVVQKTLLTKLRTRAHIDKKILDNILRELAPPEDSDDGASGRVGMIVNKIPDGATVYGTQYAVNVQGIWQNASTEDSVRYQLIAPHPLYPQYLLVGSRDEELGVLVRMPDGKEIAVEQKAIASQRPAQDLGQALGIVLYPRTGSVIQMFLGETCRLLERKSVVTVAGWDARQRLVLPGTAEIVLGPLADVPYGRTRGDEEKARAAWRKIVFEELTEKNPGVLLVLGHVYASPWREPLQLNTGALNLTGEGGGGKSNATELAMALCGPPEQLVRDFDFSRAGPERLAATARHLPIALDEPRTGRSQDALERARLLFKLISGRSATRANLHLGVQPADTWRLSVLLNGESRLIGGIGETGARRRAGEWPVVDVPLWQNPKADSVPLKLLASKFCGWPLVWGATTVLPEVWDAPENVAISILEESDRWLKATGATDVLNEFAVTLSLAKEGAALLGRVLAPDQEFYWAWWDKVEPALEKTILTLLAANVQILGEEGGADVGLRFAQEMVSFYQERPHEFMQRVKGGGGGDGGHLPGSRPPIQYSGIVWMTDDKPVEIAFYHRTVQEIAKRMGLADPSVALRSLAKRGILRCGKGRTNVLVWANGAPVRAFVLMLSELNKNEEEMEDTSEVIRF